MENVKFRGKTAGKRRIPPLGSKFRGPRKTVGPTNDDDNDDGLTTMMVMIKMIMTMMMTMIITIMTTIAEVGKV